MAEFVYLLYIKNRNKPIFNMHKSNCIHFGVESISEVEIEVMEVKTQNYYKVQKIRIFVQDPQKITKKF